MTDKYDLITEIIGSVAICGFIIWIIWFVPLCIEKQEKNKCYEIYATDNVILKRCEKYFEDKE